MKEKTLTIIFILALGFLSMANLLAPSKVFSTKENRYLQQFPTLTIKDIMSNNFSANFDTYASDQFIARDKWIGLKTLVDKSILKKDNGRVYFGKDGYLFDVKPAINQEQFDKNIKNINLLSVDLKEINKDLIINAVMVPTKASVLSNKLPLYAPVMDEKELFKQIEKELSNNINLVDLKEKLQTHNNEAIYYKTDHHWTSLGAFYAYQEFLTDQALAKDDFIIKEVTNEFLGTSYRKANFYLNSPDTIEKYIAKNASDIIVTIDEKNQTSSLYDESYLNKTDKYAYFLGGDQAVVKINTNITNGKDLLILKDSFANSMIPFLTNHYRNIYVLDTRYYNGSIKDYVANLEIDEVLMLYNIENFISEVTFSKLNK